MKNLGLAALELEDEYRSDRYNLIEDFYLPCLERTTVYSRAVGFFSSTSIIAVARGLTALIRSGGKMRLVASPSLSPEDIEAIAKGLKQREQIISHILLKELDQEFSQVARDRLSCLAWLLGNGILEIKLAIPRKTKQQGIYHEKLGIFADSVGNIVAFTGSANESSTALVNNFECIDVFCSWKGKEQLRAKRKAENFERLWQNKTDLVEVIAFPEAAARSLIRFRPSTPPSSEPTMNTYTLRYSFDGASHYKIQTPISYTIPPHHVAEAGGSYDISSNSELPNYSNFLKVELRSHQEKALAAFQKTNQGILAMATGQEKQ